MSLNLEPGHIQREITVRASFSAVSCLVIVHQAHFALLGVGLHLPTLLLYNKKDLITFEP